MKIIFHYLCSTDTSDRRCVGCPTWHRQIWLDWIISFSLITIEVDMLVPTCQCQCRIWCLCFIYTYTWYLDTIHLVRHITFSKQCWLNHFHMQYIVVIICSFKPESIQFYSRATIYVKINYITLKYTYTSNNNINLLNYLGQSLFVYFTNLPL